MNTIRSKIGFIGCGKMGEAIIKGLLDQGLIARDRIIVYDLRAERRRYLQRIYRVRIASGNKIVAKSSNTIILAVKPQKIDNALTDISATVTNTSLVISIAAGVKLKRLKAKLKNCNIIRAMPNTPALTGCGITAIASSKTASKANFNTVKAIFLSVGSVIEVSEELMDIVTAISGSGPAYFFLLIDAMIKAAISSGLTREQAEKLVLNTALGSSVLALKSQKNIQELIKMVASKGGTTEAALKVFNKRKFQQTVKEAVKAAAKRSKELARVYIG